VKFQIFGENPPKNISHPNMQITGFASNLESYIRRANVVIVPIIKGGGMRMKIIESLACGKTVISTYKGASGIPNIFGNEYFDLVITTNTLDHTKQPETEF